MDIYDGRGVNATKSLTGMYFSGQFYINVRDYRKGNQKWAIQRNWQHRVHNMEKNKTNTQHNMCWTPLYANKHK